MKNLFEQLEYNNEALERLEVRYKETLTSPYYKIFKTQNERIDELSWVLKIRKRVLRMRFRILENIQSETQKEMQYASTEIRDLLIKKVA